MVDELQEKLNEIEETVLATSSENLIPRLLQVRGVVNHLRQINPPQRDVVNRLAHGDSKMIRPVLFALFRDLRDNLIRIDEQAASYADQLLISF